MKLKRKSAAIFDSTIGYLAAVAGGLCVFAMLGVTVDVVMRYFFRSPISGMLELAEYSLLWITFLGTTWVLKRGKHIRIDIIISQLKPRTQVMFDFIFSILGLLVCIPLLWYGTLITWDSFQHNIFMMSILEMPKGVVIVFIPIGSLLLIIQFLRHIYGHWTTLRGKEQRLKPLV